MRRSLLAILLATALARPALADPCDGSFYPQGAASFADDVLQSLPLFQGGPAPTDPKFVNPMQALGAPNFIPDAGGVGGAFNGTGAVALGRGGLLALRFTDNVIVNGSGIDLGICEIGQDERYFLGLRPANQSVRALLGGLCVSHRPPNDSYCDLAAHLVGAASIDLDAPGAFPGFAAGELRFDAVQLIDAQDFNSGDKIGADIDAVGAVHSGGYLCGDERIEGTETCDDGDTDGGDGCDATCQVETCWACVGEPSLCSEADGAACDDGEPCTANDTCQATLCVGGPPPDCFDDNVCTDDACAPGMGCVNTPNTQPCDDDSSCSSGDVCDGGVCGGAPVEAVGCAPQGGKLRIVNRDDDAGDSLVWVWAKGAAEFAAGDPIGGSGRYELCVFDGPPGNRRLRVASHAAKGGLCNDRQCWKPKGATGYRYKHFNAPTGVRQLLLKSGAPGKAKIVAKGRGESLDLSGDLDLIGTVRVQLQDSAGGTCWEASFPTPLVSDERRYKAKQ